MNIAEKIKNEGRTMMPISHLANIELAARMVSNLDGVIAEVGVCKGGSAKLAHLASGKESYVFDTWAGHPPMQEDDDIGQWEGKHKADFEETKEYLKDYNIQLIKGVFPENSELIMDKKFAFVHLDTDRILGTSKGLKFFYPRMVKGGIMMFDDYPNIPTIKMVVDDFLKDKPEKLIAIEPMQAMIIKKNKVNMSLLKKPEGKTPVAVADLIKDIIQDKVVCDVGCGTGEFMRAMSKYAKEVFGIEENKEWAEIAAEKGNDVYCTNAFFQPLPKADIYYSWSKDCMGIYLKAKHEKTKGKWIFGVSLRLSTKKFLDNLGAEIRKLEGDPLWKVYIK